MSDVKLLLLQSNTWNFLNLCKKKKGLIVNKIISNHLTV